MSSPMRRWLAQWLSLQRRFDRIDVREHEDKILLLLALVVSALVGLVIVAFVAVTERMSEALLSAGGTQRFLSPVVGSLVAGWLLYSFFPEARGSGIPQTRVALLLHNGYIRGSTVVGKFLCCSLCLGSGIALGREGPSVHIGAGIASVVSRRLGLDPSRVRALIPVGTAAAVAAAFNTPLAAVLFTLEEILADLHARVVGSVVIGAATSWMVLRLILGDEPLFHVPAYQLVHPVEFLIYALLGLLGGAISALFVKLLLRLRAVFQRTPRAWQPFAPAAGGIVVGGLAFWVPGVLGVGYNLVGDALNGDLPMRLLLLLLGLKLIATTLSYSSGNAGGIFGPSLFIGAMLGGAVGQAAHTLLPDVTGNAGAYALVGMGAVFAGVVRTPMTSVIMIFELTRDYSVIVPLMITNLCSYLLSHRLEESTIYESLARQEGILMPDGHRPDPVLVERAMQPAPLQPSQPPGVFVHPDDPLDLALQRMGESGLDEIAVVSRAQLKLVGRLTPEAALDAYRRPPEPGSLQRSSLRSWLPVIAGSTLFAVLIVSGLVFWQRTRRVEAVRAGLDSGQELLARGQAEEAVLALRAALASDPSDLDVRAALGLALVDTQRFGEAEAYLEQVRKARPNSGPVLIGLARTAWSRQQQEEALRFYSVGLASVWPAGQEARRTAAQMDYARALAETGRSGQAVPLLLGIIEQRGDDAALGKAAAELVRRSGTPEQAEAAYTALSSHFPGDPAVWQGLGDAQYALDRDAVARESYRRAMLIDQENAELRDAYARLGTILDLDPTRRGLPVRERARRWDAILERVVARAATCAPAEEVAAARALMARPAATLEASDRKAEAARRLWLASRDCAPDEVLARIFARVN